MGKLQITIEDLLSTFLPLQQQQRRHKNGDLVNSVIDQS